MLWKAYYLSRMGCFEIQGSARGITSVKLVDCKPCPTGPIPPPLRPCVQQLDEYFRGERQRFELTLDFGDASAFDISVWKALTEVPYGHTTTYSKIAEQLGDPKSVRAVGQANRRNPIAIIVPCHRCIAKSGDLQGYFYGLDMKRQLLELENPLSFSRQGSLF